MDKDEVMEEGRAIQDLKRTDGWRILVEKMDEEIKSTIIDLRRISTEGRSLESVGAEYTSKVEKINGLERFKEIVDGIEEAYILKLKE